MKFELEQIAEKAAREYESNTRNPYFRTRPEELHKVLVSIILGAHELIKRADSEAPDSPSDRAIRQPRLYEQTNWTIH